MVKFALELTGFLKPSNIFPHFAAKHHVDKSQKSKDI
jgi:hypothetical protein